MVWRNCIQLSILLYVANTLAGENPYESGRDGLTPADFAEIYECPEVCAAAAAYFEIPVVTMATEEEKSKEVSKSDIDGWR
jgi:hypothetical protein